ncbi:MAG TPA: hypothetical protein VFW66_08395 [Gemmatimonadales bacterium]|nr:hypothetical protein [Gemmatimonadales bacterium]
MTAPVREVAHATCLGCGCACDDIDVSVAADGSEHIVEARNACPLGLRWFGDGRVPGRVLLRGAAASRPDAVSRIAELLHADRPVLVYLAPDISTAAQRRAIALADRVGGRLDSVTSDTAAAGILAGQCRGRATSTLGEIRNRADCLLFWAVDPAERYPRYLSRYALDPVGTQVPGGRAGRLVIAADVGSARGPADAEARLTLAPDKEIAALGVMRAALLGRALGGLDAGLAAAAELVRRLAAMRYVAIVHDAEPQAAGHSPERAEGLIGLAQALNGPTRCTLSSLRAGGNRSGADATLIWQTGYPFAVDFDAGYPRYRADEPASTLAGAIAAALVVGAAGLLPDAVARMLARVPTAVVGPRASEAPFAAEVAIDTGVAGIHEGGTGYRMDDVPLPLAAVLPGPVSAGTVLDEIAAAVAASAANRGAPAGAR